MLAAILASNILPQLGVTILPVEIGCATPMRGNPIFMDYYKIKSLEDLAEVVDDILYEEEWKPVDGYDNKYFVSSFGRIKSFVTSPNHPKNTTGVILSQSITKKGYCRCDLSKDNKKQAHAVHRLVGFAFVPNPDNLPQINHKKGIKTDNRYHQIEWNTCQQNIQAAFDTGIKSVAGEKHPRSLFTNEQVKEMRELFYSEKATITEIIEKFKTNYDTAWRIIKWYNYKDVQFLK